LEHLTHQLDSLKLGHSQEKSKLELDFTRQIADEREKFARERELARIEAERALRETELRHQDRVVIFHTSNLGWS
jgi:hypothetical protein